MKSSALTLLFLATFGWSQSKSTPSDHINFKRVVGGISGTGKMTGYWDCCKPSCAWIGNSLTAAPVASCEADGVTRIDGEVQSGCAGEEGADSYMCSDQQPWIINKTLAYGFTAASFAGGTDYSMCCRCAIITWINDTQKPKRQMLLQITNTGGDLLENQFDLAIPGCGVGYNALGCTYQWGAPENGWGAQYGGLSEKEGCADLPEPLQPGCYFRWEFLSGGIPNNEISFEEVDCPTELTDISGCVVEDS